MLRPILPFKCKLNFLKKGSTNWKLWEDFMHFHCPRRKRSKHRNVKVIWILQGAVWN